MSTDLYTAAISRVVFPIHETLKGHRTMRRWRELEKSQWLSREAIEASRIEKLRGFLRLAANDVPYYRDLFERLEFEVEVRSLAAFGRLPLLTKDIIRAHRDELKSLKAGPLTLYNTGGSTGEPLQFYIGKDRKSHDVAAKRRATRWWGVDIGDPEIVVWGSPVELGAQDRLRELRDRLFRTRLLPAFEMSEARLDEFVDAIRTMKPRMLFGYPSSLALIGRHAGRRAVDLTAAGVDVAFVTAEQLYEDQREAIQSAFGCRVANGYGGRDFGFAAHECPEGALHISAEDLIVEIVDVDGTALPDGEEGEIVVTHLATPDFPLIRYRTGDIGVLSERTCSCGRGLPVLGAVRGRTTDFVIAQDGTVMHALSMIYAVRDVPGVSHFKILQESLEHTRVLLVAGEGYTRDREALIRDRLRQRLGDDVEVTMELVDEIPRSRSGKHRYVESRVSLSERGVGATTRASSTPTP